MSRQTDQPKDSYLERLTAAQLDGEAYPQAQSEDEHEAHALFEQTDALFKELRDDSAVDLDDGWMAAVWSRVDAEDASAVDVDEDSGAPNVIETDEKVISLAAHRERARQDAPSPQATTTETRRSEARVIDASSRFRPWAYVSLMAAAAAVMLVIWLGQRDAGGPVALGPGDSPEPIMEVSQQHYDEPTSNESPESVMARVDDESAPEETAAEREPQLAHKSKTQEGADLMASAPEQEGALMDDELALDDDPEYGAAGAGVEAGEGGLMGPPEDDDGDWGGTVTGGEESKDAPMADADIAVGGATADATTATAALEETETDGADAGSAARVGGVQGIMNDNSDFATFLEYQQINALSAVEIIDVSERVILHVVDAQSAPMVDLEVRFEADGSDVFTARTHADGQLIVHPSSLPSLASTQSFNMTFEHAGDAYSVNVERGLRETYEVRVPSERTLSSADVALDIVFVFDLTPGMETSIAQLDDAFAASLTSTVSAYGLTDVRYGLVGYYDDDASVQPAVVSFGFEDNIDAFSSTLQRNSSTKGGSGSVPARLEEGLNAAINTMDWSASSATVRLVFWVGNSGPYDPALNSVRYSDVVQAAVQNGIKIYPVATDGIDASGLYVMRQVAQYTHASVLFTTDLSTLLGTQYASPPGAFDTLVLDIVNLELAAVGL